MASSKAVKLAYKTFEPKQNSGKSNIILIHGITGSKENFDNIGQELADQTNRKIYAVDLRNHGDSDWTDDFNFPLMIEDINAFLTDHQITKPVFLGHSLGGRLTMIYTLLQPENVDKIIVEDMTPKKLTNSTLKMVDTYMKLIKIAFYNLSSDIGIDQAKKIVVQRFLSLVPPHLKEGSINWEVVAEIIAEDIIQKGGKFSFKANLEALLKTFDCLHFDENLDGIFEGGSFFIYGKASDFKIGDDVDFIRSHFPLAKFHGIEEATHDVHFEKPEEFIAKVADYLNSN